MFKASYLTYFSSIQHCLDSFSSCLIHFLLIRFAPNPVYDVLVIAANMILPGSTKCRPRVIENCNPMTKSLQRDMNVVLCFFVLSFCCHCITLVSQLIRDGTVPDFWNLLTVTLKPVNQVLLYIISKLLEM